jgi:hypothetical protein
MTPAPAEYLIRVRATDDGYSATCRQFAGCAHPEVRATLGPVSWGQGATVREVPSHGC